MDRLQLFLQHCDIGDYETSASQVSLLFNQIMDATKGKRAKGPRRFGRLMVCLEKQGIKFDFGKVYGLRLKNAIPSEVEAEDMSRKKTGWISPQAYREKYHKYLCSREWSLKRRAVFDRCKGICERCKAMPMMHVHHLSYIRVFNERLEDLQGLCDKCHEFIHAKERKT